MKRTIFAFVVVAALTLGFSALTPSTSHAQIYGAASCSQTYVLSNYVGAGGTVALGNVVITLSAGGYPGESFTVSCSDALGTAYLGSYGSYGFASSYVPGYSVGISPYSYGYSGLGYYGGGLTWPYYGAGNTGIGGCISFCNYGGYGGRFRGNGTGGNGGGGDWCKDHPGKCGH